jgi:protein TonB
MTSQQILEADLLDILFDKRNKLYGAYSLRKEYSSNLLKAVGATTLLVLALLFFVNPSTENPKPTKTNAGFNLISVVMPVEKKTEAPKLKVQQSQSQPTKQENLNTNLKIIDNPVDPLATQNDLQNANIGRGKIGGPISIGIQNPELPIFNSGTDDIETSKKEIVLVSRQPQFPGGSEAWLKFLNTYLYAPSELEAGEKRTVHIRFWVDELGAITNFQVVHSGGSAFDNEVIRVLKKMPKWMPALQNGKPIAVSFTQPVTFAAEE